jgi:ABC-type nitrate/sulfonate/bicarbonate transport system substrate-binding protein
MNKLRPCLLAALAATLALDAAAQEKIQDKVTFALNWIPSGNHFGVFAAKDRDLYRDANVDVDIQRGYGSGDTLKRVATGNGVDRASRSPDAPLRNHRNRKRKLALQEPS